MCATDSDLAKTDEILEITLDTKLRIYLNSGVTEENIGDFLSVSLGVIATSLLKEDDISWKPVSESKVKNFMKIVHKLRELTKVTS